MVKCKVIDPFTVETPQRVLTLNVGDTIALSPDKAEIFIGKGKVKPILSEEDRYRFEERAAIMEYDGGLDREEAERQAWCRTACMLSFPSQWKTCTRFHPKPCVKINLNQREG